MDDGWNRRKVLVAGGCGYIGAHLVRLLVRKNARVRVVDDLSRGELAAIADVSASVELQQADLQSLQAAETACRGMDVVFNLAANASGLCYSLSHHASMFYDNVIVSLNVLEAARRQGVRRYLYFSSSSIYPENVPVPTPESYGRVAEPEASNFGYGWAKRVGELQADIYRDECEMAVTALRPVNVFGEGEHYDLEIGHVIPSLIIKAHQSERLRVMGSGRQTRAFIYVKDLCEIALVIAQKGEEVTALNVCSPEEVTIGDIARLILEEAAPDMPIEFDTGQPEGARRKAADLTQMMKLLGTFDFTSLREGIRRMIAEYRNLLTATESRSF